MSWLRANSNEVEGETIDLSISGARFESALPVRPGRQITVKLILPGTQEPVVIERAEVQWIHDQTFGVRFLEVRRQELDELEELIDEYLALDEGGEA